MLMYRVKLYVANDAGEVSTKIISSLGGVQIVEDNPDIIFSASWPHRITKEMREQARLCAVNIHTGLLPQQRGVQPLNWALIWGDKQAGVTIHEIVDSFDAGDIVLQAPVSIGEHDTINDLKHKCFKEFEPLIKKFFEKPKFYLDKAVQQNQANVTYAPKRRYEDSQININASNEEKYRLFRACDPEEYPAFVIEGKVKRLVKRVTPQGEIIYKN